LDQLVAKGRKVIAGDKGALGSGRLRHRCSE
jgi:hypothetical protein